MVWLDSNPCPRHAGEKTSRAPEFERIFPLSEELLDVLGPEIVWVQQETNHEMIVTRLAPTHVLHSSEIPGPDNLLPDSLAQTLDSDWLWDFGRAGEVARSRSQLWRPIRRSEQALWFYYNVVDASRLLPFAPKSLFVRQHHGIKDRLFVFSPHICLVDQIRYPSQFLAVVEETVRSAAAISSLFPPTETSSSAISEVGLVLANPGYETALARQFGLTGLAGNVFLDARRNGDNVVKALTEVRKAEIRTQASFDAILGPALRELAVHICFDSNDVGLLVDYVPRQSAMPPSFDIG